MSVSDITLVGWFHTLFCFVAMFAGARNLIAEKGTPAHRYAGQWYIASMVLLNVSALFIYRAGKVTAVQGVRLDRFSAFHWMAVFTLAVIAFAYFAARRQHRGIFAYAHPAAMVVSYYMLVGGAVNEVFVHVTSLRPYGYVRLPHSNVVVSGPAVTVTHMTVLFLSFGLLTWFMAKVASHRAGERSAPAVAAAE